jgi:hypothetical protein
VTVEFRTDGGLGRRHDRQGSAPRAGRFDLAGALASGLTVDGDPGALLRLRRMGAGVPSAAAMPRGD